MFFRSFYRGASFILPVVIFAFLYTLPKFFELRVAWEPNSLEVSVPSVEGFFLASSSSELSLEEESAFFAGVALAVEAFAAGVEGFFFASSSYLILSDLIASVYVCSLYLSNS